MAQYGGLRRIWMRRIAQFGAKLSSVRIAAFLLSAALTLASGCTNRDVPGNGFEVGVEIPEIDALFAVWDRPGSPGCSLAVAQDGELLYSRGYGYANLDHDIPMTPQSVVDVASVNKQFMAAMLNMLAAEGALSLDDDVRNFLPELPAYDTPITLRHMLYHTSGLRDYLTLFPLAGRDHYNPISHRQILEMMARQKALNFQPGERYEYSNTAFMLLAQVIERVSEQSLGDFAHARVFEPLGMTGSLMYDDYEEVIPRRATGYDRHSDDDIRMVHNFNFDVPGDGQLYSTVEDLLRWDEYLHGPDKPPYYESILTEGRLNNGDLLGLAQGLYLGKYRGQRTIHHTGSSWGSTSILIRFVESGLAVAITCNDGNAARWPMVHRIADHYLQDQLDPVEDNQEQSAGNAGAEDSIEAIEFAHKGLPEFSGTYFSVELDATYRVMVDRGALQVRIEQEPPLSAKPIAEDRFDLLFGERAYAGVMSASLAFVRDADGAVSGFKLSSGTESDIIFEKQQ